MTNAESPLSGALQGPGGTTSIVAQPIDPRNSLLEATRRARDLGYRFAMCALDWNPARGRKRMILTPGKDWHQASQLDDQTVQNQISAGCNAYIIHGPTSGVTLLDGDNAAECAKLGHATGSGPLVLSPSGPDRAHWYVRGVVHDPALKTIKTAFGPGSFYSAPEGLRVYMGALAPIDALPTLSVSPFAQAAPVAQASMPPGPRDPFWDPPAMSRDRAWGKAREMLNALAKLPVTTDGKVMRDRISGAALFLGGLLHTGLFDRTWAEDALCRAVGHVFGRYNDADLKWINDGLNDGVGKPIEVAPEPPPFAVGTAEVVDEDDQDFAFVTAERFRDRTPPPEAAYGAFGGARGLFYAEGVHWLQGASESGKSWVALAVAAEVLQAGESVLFVDYEHDAGAVLERLEQLGVEDDEIGRLVYVAAADVPFDKLASHVRTTTRDYALMVVDGVTSALSSAGKSGRDEQEVTQWVDALPRKVRAAICIDHVVKARDDRMGMAIGSQAKKSVVTGTAFEVECTNKFGRGMTGTIELTLQKDKPGGVRPGIGKGVRLQFSSDRQTGAVELTQESAETSMETLFDNRAKVIELCAALAADKANPGAGQMDLERRLRVLGCVGGKDLMRTAIKVYKRDHGLSVPNLSGEWAGLEYPGRPTHVMAVA